MTNIQTYSCEYENPSVGAIAGGAAVGMASKVLLNKSSGPISRKILPQLLKAHEGISRNEYAQIRETIENYINKSGLKGKGVSILDANNRNLQAIKDAILKDCNKGLCKHLPEKLKKRVVDNAAQLAVDGKNAFYSFSSKQLILPKKALGYAHFHELGHAINANISSIGKFLQKSRHLALLATPIFLIGLFKTKKAEGEKPKGAIDKTTNFIKENAGKLTFLAFMPLLIEETMATIKGAKIAKKTMGANVAKKVLKTGAWGGASYLAVALLTTLGTTLAIKIKDAIAHRKQV